MEPKDIIIAKWRKNVEIELIHIISSQFEMASMEFVPDIMNEGNNEQNTNGYSNTEDEKN